MRYPLYMTFFSTPDKLEIGGLPFVTAADKPTRREALTYYRKVAEYFELDVRQYHEVHGVRRSRDGFELTARHPGKTEPETVQARHVVHATGYFESPNAVGVPGEDLPHVSHFFTEGHPYWQQRVVVIGGGNSAVEAALDLHRRRPGVRSRREQDLHRERPRTRRAHLRAHQSKTPQGCPWGVIACSTSCALEPDASETKLVLEGPNKKPRAPFPGRGAGAILRQPGCLAA